MNFSFIVSHVIFLRSKKNIWLSISRKLSEPLRNLFKHDVSISYTIILRYVRPMEVAYDISSWFCKISPPPDPLQLMIMILNPFSNDQLWLYLYGVICEKRWEYLMYHGCPDMIKWMLGNQILSNFIEIQGILQRYESWLGKIEKRRYIYIISI